MAAETAAPPAPGAMVKEEASSPPSLVREEGGPPLPLVKVEEESWDG